MSVPILEQELRKACRMKAFSEMEIPYRQTYLQMLSFHALNEIDDDTWESLSTAAQQWAKEAGKAAKAKKPIPDFNKERSNMEAQVSSTNSSKSKSSSSSSTKKASSSSSKAPAKKVKPSRPQSPREFIRRAVIKKPSISIEALQDALHKAGLKATPLFVASARSSVRGVLKIMKEEGMIKVEL